MIYVWILLYSFAVNGHLGYFHVLATMQSAAVNTGVHVSLWIIVLSRNILRSETAGSYGNSVFFVLRGTSILFPIVAVPTYIPTRVQESSLFSTSSPAFVMCGVLKIILFTYPSFLAVVGLCCCAGAFLQLRCTGSSLWWPLLLQGTQASAV